MKGMHTLVPPNWRPLPLLGPHAAREHALYRAAALSHATPAELTECPDDLVWLDLRTRGELEAEATEHVPAAWAHVHAPFLEIEVQAGQEADTLEGLINGTTTFGDHYCHMVDAATANIAHVLRTIGSTERAVVIACQGGRDRTGLISAILLLIAGAPPQVAIDDYLRTNEDLRENLQRQPGGEQTQELFTKLDLVCRPADIAQAIDHLAGRGGIRAYLADHVSATDYDRLARNIRMRLGLEPAPSVPSHPVTALTDKEPAP